MNNIIKHPITELGYDFIDKSFLPKGKDEYYLRNKQNTAGINYRQLTSSEKEILIRNGNSSDDWSNVHVSGIFDPVLVKNNKFFGLVRIGKLEAYYLEFHNLRMPVGIYNSTIISSDFGDNVCIDNANYLSHYIVGNEVMIANINELATTNYSKFGNGTLKEGEDESTRIWLEIRNENGGRKVIPFADMLPGDAWLWSTYPHDEKLQEKLKEFTAKETDHKRGYYGTIGDRTVLKDCDIIKDVVVGTDAYIKGANKLKNLTINSDAERKSQIGEGCEMVNGIVGYGCRIFYGVKAVRFIMAPHSQLKYGARLINSYLGSNSTISCCEVLNSLIYPNHEQHHNNSFLCASLVEGQSNIAAGATIGSNHNSRAADGELVAKRGFWPGLCVSLKHNCKFASFTILAKGDFPYELNIPLPFSLVSNEVAFNRLVIMPGYWFMYNMYALARNSWKFRHRDMRTVKTHKIEYDFLAPDTINEMFDSVQLLSGLTIDKEGHASVPDFENSNRETVIIKVKESITLFKELIGYYGITQLIQHYQANKFDSFDDFKKSVPTRISRNEWKNIGGQLFPVSDVQKLISNIKSDKLSGWNQVHQFYEKEGDNYEKNKLIHAYTSLLELQNITSKQFTLEYFEDLVKKAVITKEWISRSIYESRAKDYTNSYRKMMYESQDEMDSVIGKIEDNQFIQSQFEELETFKKDTSKLLKKIRQIQKVL